MKFYTIGVVIKKDLSHVIVKVFYVMVGSSEFLSADLLVKKEGGFWKVCVMDLLLTLPTSLLILMLVSSLLIEFGLLIDTSLFIGLLFSLLVIGVCVDLSNVSTFVIMYMMMVGFGFMV